MADVVAGWLVPASAKPVRNLITPFAEIKRFKGSSPPAQAPSRCRRNPLPTIPWLRRSSIRQCRRLSPRAIRCKSAVLAKSTRPSASRATRSSRFSAQAGLTSSRSAARKTASTTSKLAKQIRPETHVIALAIEGRKLDSLQFAAELQRLATYGRSQVAFVIGGSLGLSPQVLRRADLTLSFGAMTYPHQLMRLILVEQIYRAFKIIRGEPYHK